MVPFEGVKQAQLIFRVIDPDTGEIILQPQSVTMQFSAAEYEKIDSSMRETLAGNGTTPEQVEGICRVNKLSWSSDIVNAVMITVTGHYRQAVLKWLGFDMSDLEAMAKKKE